MASSPTIVIATRNRRAELLGTLDRLVALEGPPPVVVVDNGSTDGTALAVAERHPAVEVVPLPANIGAAARTVGARRARTPLLAFSDDDSWWAPGSLRRAAHLFDARCQLALVAARVVVEPGGATDPTCRVMAASPLGPPTDAPAGTGLRQVLGFLACGAVVRRDAFLGVGGFRPELVVGGEEAMVAIDLAAAGWELLYAPDVVAHHRPSPHRLPAERRRLEVRNALWTAWARRPARSAARCTLDVACTEIRSAAGMRGLADAVAGTAWVARHRAVVPPAVERSLSALDRWEG